MVQQRRLDMTLSQRSETSSGHRVAGGASSSSSAATSWSQHQHSRPSAGKTTRHLIIMLFAVIAICAGTILYRMLLDWGETEGNRTTKQARNFKQAASENPVYNKLEHSKLLMTLDRSLPRCICSMAPHQQKAHSPVITVLAIGDSITYGNGSHVRRKERDHEGNYPVSLEYRLNKICHGQQLGSTTKIQVVNLGHSGRTLLDGFKQSYRNSSVYKQAVSLAPHAHVAVIMLGTNDSKQRHWRGREPFETALIQLILELSSLNKNIKVLVITPPPSFPDPRQLRRGKQRVLGGIRPAVIKQDIRVAVMSAAHRTNSDVLDLFGEFANMDELDAYIGGQLHDEDLILPIPSEATNAMEAAKDIERYFHDGVHPSLATHEIMAETVATMLCRGQ